MHLGSAAQYDRLESRLIDLIYAALVDEGAWGDFLRELATCTPNGQSTLFFHDEFSAAGSISLSHGVDREFERLYPQYAPKNLWMQNLHKRPIGLGVRSEFMVPFAEVKKSEYYNDLLRSFGIESGIGITLQRSGSLNFLLSVIGARQPDADEQRAADMLTRLAPHLTRVFKIYGQAQERSSLLAIGQALAAHETGVMRVGPGRKIQWLNDAARALVGSGDGLHRDAADRLRLADETLDAALGQMVELGVPQDARSRTLTGTIRRSGAALRVTLAGSGQSLVERYFAGPTVTVLLSEEQHGGMLPADLVAATFNLTTREAEVTMALVAGHSLQAIAATLNISYETTRAHLKQVFAKTGTRRQAELLARLYAIGRAQK